MSPTTPHRSAKSWVATCKPKRRPGRRCARIWTCSPTHSRTVSPSSSPPRRREADGMKSSAALRQLGTTQQKLLRKLLLAPQGASVELLCEALGVTHNAVRQHLTALIGTGLVERGNALPTGGRPQSRYLLTSAGRELFPRNYGLIATGILEHLYAKAGKADVQAMLADMGHS